MNLPNVLTTSRLYLSPLYFLAFFLPLWVGNFQVVGFVVLVVIYLVIEVSDVLDGHIARSRDLVSDYGKLMDPFADIISRLTYFVCFATVGVMPVWALMVVIYREFGIVFLRMIMFGGGKALAARGGGKIKAGLYALSGLAGLVVVASRRGILPAGVEAIAQTVATVVFSLAAVSALLSFLDYVRVFRDWRRGTDAK